MATCSDDELWTILQEFGNVSRRRRRRDGGKWRHVGEACLDVAGCRDDKHRGRRQHMEAVDHIRLTRLMEADDRDLTYHV